MNLEDLLSEGKILELLCLFSDYEISDYEGTLFLQVIVLGLVSTS